MYAALTVLALVHGARYVNSTFLFWGWSEFIHIVAPPSLIYVPHVLYAFEHGIPGAPLTRLPFAYPPSLLLLIWPLAWASPVTSFVLWTGVSLALYLWATWQRGWGSLSATLALVAPGTVAAVYAAQTSLLAAALMIGGCRLIGRRPIVAGVLFGLLTVKPQYGMLLPIALVSARQWRCVAAAAATTILSVLASGAAFGWSAWTRLPTALVGLSRLVAGDPLFDPYSLTVTSGLRMLGVGPALTETIQLAAAACTAVAVWFCFRRGVTPLGTAVLMVGAFLVTPYAFYYDLPMVGYAVLIFVIERTQDRQPFGTGELLVMISTVAMPLLMRVLWLPWGMVVFALLFGLIVHRIAILGRNPTAAAA